jgi:hypothetical protein
MFKRQRPSSPSPSPAAYGDDLSPPNLGPSMNMNTPSIQLDSSFGISRKRPRVSPDTISGVGGVGGGVGRHTFLSSSVLSKRRRSSDPMDNGEDSDGDSGSRSGPQIPSTCSDYQREGESSDPFASRPTTAPKRRRTTAPVLEGSSRGWGPDQASHFGIGPNPTGPSPYPHSFDLPHPPVGWILETQTGEYAQENAKLHDLHTLRPRLPNPEDVTQDYNGIPSVDVDMEEKVVKERYEERNKYALSPLDAYISGCLTVPSGYLDLCSWSDTEDLQDLDLTLSI